MSFNLSRPQFLQMFSVMQSIRMIGSHTAVRAAPGIAWSNNNLENEQFAVLTSLVAKTPKMLNLKSLPSGSTAPILINPFEEGCYLPHSGPGFVAIHETGELNINENALFGAMDAHISTAFTNLIRLVNTRVDCMAMPGAAFSNFHIKNTIGAAYKASELHFITEDGMVAIVEGHLPHILLKDSEESRKLEEIMRHFIGQSMIDADIASGVLTLDSINVETRRSNQDICTQEKTLEQKLMECPIWATW
ncbi:hypothetical protein OH773_22175 (plasmid) [Buttiauxella sp. WJP83]|uniref:hypothetical protein n=1 Tax=Buttiauxella sp. WJP83 TaxID=2986951 RepID=UPI0022DE7C6C|nr:hypothetical protein [Buttiauxella sp. WJP83]WBM72953.1 hypothetical protein OH773_22175 [Buttiauxella sp. WJP83]